jgi:hypothetical protein
LRTISLSIDGANRKIDAPACIFLATHNRVAVVDQTAYLLESGVQTRYEHGSSICRRNEPKCAGGVFPAFGNGCSTEVVVAKLALPFDFRPGRLTPTMWRITREECLCRCYFRACTPEPPPLALR